MHYDWRNHHAENALPAAVAGNAHAVFASPCGGYGRAGCHFALQCLHRAAQETLRPGKAVTLRFTSPVDGTVTLLLRNAETLETVLPVAKDYPVTAGENQMLWNGTYEGVFAPEGIYRLVAQFSDGSEADTAILVGQIAPFLTSISALESTEDGEVRLSFYASENGRLTLGLWGASWSLLENIDISAGTNEVTVDATALSPDTVAISLTLTDDTGYC